MPAAGARLLLVLLAMLALMPGACAAGSDDGCGDDGCPEGTLDAWTEQLLPGWKGVELYSVFGTRQEEAHAVRIRPAEGESTCDQQVRLRLKQMKLGSEAKKMHWWTPDTERIEVIDMIIDTKPQFGAPGHVASEYVLRHGPESPAQKGDLAIFLTPEANEVWRGFMEERGEQWRAAEASSSRSGGWWGVWRRVYSDDRCATGDFYRLEGEYEVDRDYQYGTWDVVGFPLCSPHWFELGGEMERECTAAWETFEASHPDFDDKALDDVMDELGHSHVFKLTPKRRHRRPEENARQRIVRLYRQRAKRLEKEQNEIYRYGMSLPTKSFWMGRAELGYCDNAIRWAAARFQDDDEGFYEWSKRVLLPLDKCGARPVMGGRMLVGTNRGERLPRGIIDELLREDEVEVEEDDDVDRGPTVVLCTARAAREAAIAGNDICEQMSYEPEAVYDEGDEADDDEGDGDGGDETRGCAVNPWGLCVKPKATTTTEDGAAPTADGGATGDPSESKSKKKTKRSKKSGAARRAERHDREDGGGEGGGAAVTPSG